jgi:hypothetical protein
MIVYQPDNRVASFQPMMFQNSLMLEPFNGGDIQRVDRLGDRWGASFVTPKLSEATSRDWQSFIINGLAGAIVVMDWIELGQPSRGYGTPLVRGASQLGSSLIIDGLSANQRIEPSKFFSIKDGAKRSLHTVRERVTADGSGIVTLNIWPMLPWSPSDNAVIELAKPKLQGIMTTQQENAMLDINRHVQVSATVRQVYDDPAGYGQ